MQLFFWWFGENISERSERWSNPFLGYIRRSMIKWLGLDQVEAEEIVADKTEGADWQVVGRAQVSALLRQMWVAGTSPQMSSYSYLLSRDMAVVRMLSFFTSWVPSTSRRKNMINCNTIHMTQKINCQPRSMDFTGKWFGVKTEATLFSLIEGKIRFS